MINDQEEGYCNGNSRLPTAIVPPEVRAWFYSSSINFNHCSLALVFKIKLLLNIEKMSLIIITSGGGNMRKNI